jgi:dTDP-4-dehydrorhamnose reductase
MNVLITGASGFIGGLLLNALNKNLHIIGTVFNGNISSNGCKHKHIDLSDEHEVRMFFNNNRFDIIFHFAGYLTSRLNDENPTKASLYNVKITKNIVNNASKSCHIVFLSTDKVFDGSIGYPDEDTPVSPCCLYGELKYNAEEIIRKKLYKHHIFRLPIVHSSGNLNSISFIDKSIFSIKKSRITPVFGNVKRCFLRADELVNLLIASMDNKCYGIYNVGTKSISYHDRLVQLLKEEKVEYAGLIDKSTGSVNPIEQNLNTSKVTKVFGLEFS